MKKIVAISLLMFVFLTGCRSRNDETIKSSSDPVINNSYERTDSSSSKKDHSTSKTTQESASSMTEGDTNSNTSTETPATSNDPLSAYSAEQIEYARVWLAVMGTGYKNDLSNGEFTLNVTLNPSGTKINPYDENSLTYPSETVVLSGKYGYQSLIVYSSNHNGSITHYPTPSHFQQPTTRQEEQAILDNAQIITIPTGNSDDIKQLIGVINVEG